MANPTQSQGIPGEQTQGEITTQAGNAQHNLDEPLKPTCEGWTEVITSWWERDDARVLLARVDYGNAVRLDVTKYLTSRHAWVKLVFVLDKTSKTLHGFYLECPGGQAELIESIEVPDPIYNHVLMLFNNANARNAMKIADAIEGVFQTIASPTFEELDEDEKTEVLNGIKTEIENAVRGGES